MASKANLYRDASRAAYFGLAVNLSLGVIKLLAGFAADSFALLSDAVNSLGDSLTSVVVLFGLWVAQKPPDAEHPYGHTRAEAVAGCNVATLILVSALFIMWQAFERFGQPRGIPPLWTLWIAGSNVLIKEALYRYKANVGRRLGSASLIANAWDHRSDALCSLAVLISLAVMYWGGVGFDWVDSAAALLVAAAILWSGTQLLKSTASELMDVQANKDLVDRIRETAAAVDGVAAVEKLWVRKSGLEYLVDIHIEVDGAMTVAQGHEIGHRVKDRLLERIVNLCDVLVHLEPHTVARPIDIGE